MICKHKKLFNNLTAILDDDSRFDGLTIDLRMSMTNNALDLDCRFCSVISKANREDPIGSASACDHWLIAEVPQPWPITIGKDNPIVAAVVKMMEPLLQQGMSIRPLMIAPDKAYSQPEQIRVFYYYKPNRRFAKFEKQEYLLPASEIVSLVAALLQQPDRLSQFDAYRQPTQHIREIFVCTHGNVDVACSRFGYPIYNQLRREYAKTSFPALRVWRCSHFGGHKFAPTLVDLPEGRYWGHLEPEILETLIHRNTPVSRLRPFYRGWAGLGKYEQIVEREMWMRFGWDWVHYLKAGKTVAIDPDHDKWNADWAEVHLEYASPDGRVQETYSAWVEVSGYVATKGDSENQELTPAKQYRVSQLTQIN